MIKHKGRFLFLNVGHTLDHLFMLLYPTVVLSLEGEFGMTYQELLPLSVGGFIAFGAGAIPSGWLGDRWSRRKMMILFFVGIGLASVLTGLSTSLWQIAAGLTLVGVFASIYHPVGVAMVVEDAQGMGKVLGINGVYGNLGVAAAALTAGALTDLIHWRAAFIIPGILSVVVGVFFALAIRETPRGEKSASASKVVKLDSRALARVIGVIVITTVFGGIIFHSTLVSLPKVFSIRMTDFAGSAIGIGGLVSLVYTFGAFSQILVGHLIDRHPIRGVLFGIAVLQVPFLVAASQLTNTPLLIIAGLMMFTIFGAIPITDTMIARYSADHIRSRLFAIKYLAALGVSSLAVPLISLVYGSTGDFTYLFGSFALISILIAGAALFLPGGNPGDSTQPVPSQAGAGAD